MPSLYHCRFYTPVLALSMSVYPVRFAHFPLCVFFPCRVSYRYQTWAQNQGLGRGDINVGINVVTTAFDCHTIPTTNLRPSTRVLKHHPSPLLARSSKRENCNQIFKNVTHHHHSPSKVMRGEFNPNVCSSFSQHVTCVPVCYRIMPYYTVCPRSHPI